MNAKIMMLLIVGGCSLASLGRAESGTSDRPIMGHSETWKNDRFGYETWRSDTGEVWKKDRFGYETWRSNDGRTCKTDRYGGAVRCN
jgi:hypothetical protein